MEETLSDDYYSFNKEFLKNEQKSPTIIKDKKHSFNRLYTFNLLNRNPHKIIKKLCKTTPILEGVLSNKKSSGTPMKKLHKEKIESNYQCYINSLTKNKKMGKNNYATPLKSTYENEIDNTGNLFQFYENINEENEKTEKYNEKIKEIYNMAHPRAK